MACSGVPGLGALTSDEAGSIRFGFGPGGVVGWTMPSVGVIAPVLAAGLAGLRVGWLSFVLFAEARVLFDLHRRAREFVDVF